MNNFIKFLVFVMVFTMSLGVMAPMPSEAAGVTMLVTVGSSWSGNYSNFSYPQLDQSPAEWDGTATEVYIAWSTSGDEYATNDTITIVASTPLTIATTCGTPTTDIDGDALADGSGSVTGDTYTYTFTQATTLATKEVCLAVSALATPGNYSFSMSDNKTTGGADNDYGAAMLYGLDDNDVIITADVRTELEFNIRDVGDTANTNACALGVLSTSSVSTCEYRLKVRTNASSGYTVSWTSDGPLDLTVGGAGGPDIDAIAEDGTVSAASEEYGVAVTADYTDTTGYTCTEENIWNDDDSPVSTTPTALFECYAPNQPAATGATANTALVEHRAAISTTTGSGHYEQVVTYYVTGNF